ncbi:hypothetical protein DRO91_06570 [Candidatus Heimdallarchaeota archaeon]|nr:MAG: hypothetical protein DRO91_06570 [Candidatus Heimdallarchaeota archaeon]
MTTTKAVKKTVVVNVPKELRHIEGLLKKSRKDWESELKEFNSDPSQENLDNFYAKIPEDIRDHCSDILNRYIRKNSILSKSPNACGLQYNRNWTIGTCERLLLLGGSAKCNSAQLNLCGKFCLSGKLRHSRKKFQIYKIALAI